MTWSFLQVIIVPMAASNDEFIVRYQSGEGIFVIRGMSPRTTVAELKQNLSRDVCTRPELIKILTGFPPQALEENDQLTLEDVNYRSGQVLIIQMLPPPIITPTPGPGITVDPYASVRTAELTLDPQGSGDLIAATFQGYSAEVLSGIMMRRVVPSNNSCLFTSVYFLLSNGDENPEKSNDLRRVIAQVVAANPEKFNDAVLDRSNQDYCSWIMNTAHWGGAIELSILSQHFGIEIVAIDTASLTAHRFGENLSYPNRIFLIYDGIHYDPLVLEFERGAFQTIFSANDPQPLNLALEVAREARASRQYTDVVNFTLRCLQCNVRLQGDFEARRHAVDTGHVEFGEINE